jgi:hypothetical protein
MKTLSMPTQMHALVVAACAATAGSCVNDPVQNTRLTAFGDDFPVGLEETAYHRPGQPCVTCHGDRGSASPKFAAAGTIFWGSCNITKTEAADEKLKNERCDLTPVRDAEIRIVSASGRTSCAVTNCWGNFTFPVTGSNSVDFPFLVSIAKKGLDGQYLQQAQMGGHVSREGSCSGCHDNPRRADSPGQVFLYAEDTRTGKINIPPAARAVIDRDRTLKCPNEEPLRTCQ